jgi:hypothetical protein
MAEPGCIRGIVLLSETARCKMEQEKEYDTFRTVATVCWQYAQVALVAVCHASIHAGKNVSSNAGRICIQVL